MSRASLHVLVVEGADAVGQAIAGLLRRRGHTAEVVSSASHALRARACDVLVSDLVLPDCGGLELLCELQRRGQDPRAVLVGARPSLDESRRALELGAAELLSKPFRLSELLRAVEGTQRARPLRSASAAAFDQSYPALASSVELAARELCAFALASGISPAARARIASATSEIVDNARRHGYCRGTGRIRVEAHLEGGDFVVRVGDEGIGFDASALDARDLDDTLRHGLARARALAEELEIESRPEHGTRVLLVFRVSSVAFEEESGIDLSELDFLGPELSRKVLHALRESREQDLFHLSPALAVVVGRLLAGPDPRRGVEQALWS